MQVDSNLLPHRLRESCFRRFEQTIRSIVEEYPNVVTISAGNLSPLTVAGRLRDAMLSLHRYSWQTDIDIVKFREIYNGIIVSHRGTAILAGGRDQLRQFDPMKPVSSDVAPPIPALDQNAEVHELSLEALKIVCKMAAKGILSKALQFTCPVPHDVLMGLEDSYDVRIDKVKEGVYSVS